VGSAPTRLGDDDDPRNVLSHLYPPCTPAPPASSHRSSDRGGHDVDVILRFCANRGINQIYVIGGDGTHRGAHAIFAEAAKRGLPLAVAAIPKTIDNDVDIIDRSFGFDSAYSEAQRAIKTAKTEAAGAPNGIGIVKVMGRYAGFIAAYATLASGDVDCVLVPELPVALSGPCSILEHLRRVVAAQGHAVVVVAEGACAWRPHERERWSCARAPTRAAGASVAHLLRSVLVRCPHPHTAPQARRRWQRRRAPRARRSSTTRAATASCRPWGSGCSPS